VASPRERDLEVGVLHQDGPLQASELGARGQAEILEQPHAQLLVAGESVGLAPGPVERPHVRGAQPLPSRMAPHQLVELSDERGVLTESEAGVHQVLQRRDTLLLQPPGERQSERLVGVVGQRGPTPEGQRVGEPGSSGGRRGSGPGLGHDRCEPLGVDRVGVDPQLVSRRGGGDQVPAPRFGLLQRPPELRDLGVESTARLGRGVAVPQVLDQPVGRDRLAGMDEQVGQQGTDLRPGNRDSRATVVPHRERPEQAEPHAETVPPASGSRPSAGGQRFARPLPEPPCTDDADGLVVIALPCLVYAMDPTVLNLALPALSADLQPSSSELLWIVDTR